ncbi:glycerophosphodiester phosphodiesterase family protein [Sphingobacterium psychroaquaticum]|uniref:glycerophosphodiester phosphodiesterase family protein n=1 Tax=Sphingobacterium psychroaquaticum TaxID=561061 RepID=UPI0019D0A5AB|nr:glycerophosphodiester phosphodiesterase family protein [Sphingobacterium psychroaquaticum]
MLFLSSVLHGQVVTHRYVTLDNYRIPLAKKGAVIGRVITINDAKVARVKLIHDTSKLFNVSEDGVIRLRKGRALYAGKGGHAFGITLQISGKSYPFELVKDEFLTNKVIAHRGAWRKVGVMQNSIRSFQHAVELGCEGSEFDVWLSGDGVVVLSHDPHIGGLTVEESTAKDLYASTLSNGDPVPSLVEFITIATKQNKTKMVLEIKPSPTGKALALADSVISIVHRIKAQAYIEYISFDYAVLKRIRELDKSAKTAYLYGDKTVEELKKDGITGLDYDFYKYRKDTELVEKAKRLGLTTNVWTVNEEQELLKYLRSDVDMITTDEPELLLHLINQLK